MEVPGHSGNGCSAKATQVQDDLEQCQAPISPNPSPTMQATQDNLEELQVCGKDQLNNGPCSSQVSPWDVNGVGCSQPNSIESSCAEIKESYINIAVKMENQLAQVEKLLGGKDAALEALKEIREIQQLVLKYHVKMLCGLELINEREKIRLRNANRVKMAKSMIGSVEKAVSDEEKRQIEIKHVLACKHGVDVSNLGTDEQLPKMQQIQEKEQDELLDAKTAEVSPELDPPPPSNAGNGENERNTK